MCGSSLFFNCIGYNLEKECSLKEPECTGEKAKEKLLYLQADGKADVHRKTIFEMIGKCFHRFFGLKALPINKTNIQKRNNNSTEHKNIN